MLNQIICRGDLQLPATEQQLDFDARNLWKTQKLKQSMHSVSTAMTFLISFTQSFLFIWAISIVLYVDYLCKWLSAKNTLQNNGLILLDRSLKGKTCYAEMALSAYSAHLITAATKLSTSWRLVAVQWTNYLVLIVTSSIYQERQGLTAH